MNISSFLKRAVGVLFVCVGMAGLTGLFFFYSVILFSDSWTVLDGLTDAFKFLFSVPTGIVVIYASFFAIFIPFLLLLLLGILISSGKKYLTLWQIGAIVLFWILAIILALGTTVHQMQKIITQIDPIFNMPVSSEAAREIPLEVRMAFSNTLKNEVNEQKGIDIREYEPAMFLEVFPGLAETDFEGVQSSIGTYTVIEGRITHSLDETRLIHEAAKAITDEGLHTLLANVALRLGIDLTTDGTLTEVMNALVRTELIVPEAPSTPVESVACTMDAMICPDGSAVGRQGPSCEFTPCP